MMTVDFMWSLASLIPNKPTAIMKVRPVVQLMARLP